MENLEWLESTKKSDEKAKSTELYFGREEYLKYRKLKALEIIAEELIGIREATLGNLANEDTIRVRLI